MVQNISNSHLMLVVLIRISHICLSVARVQYSCNIAEAQIGSENPSYAYDLNTQLSIGNENGLSFVRGSEKVALQSEKEWKIVIKN